LKVKLLFKLSGKIGVKTGARWWVGLPGKRQKERQQIAVRKFGGARRGEKPRRTGGVCLTEGEKKGRVLTQGKVVGEQNQTKPPLNRKQGEGGNSATSWKKLQTVQKTTPADLSKTSRKKQSVK